VTRASLKNLFPVPRQPDEAAGGEALSAKQHLLRMEGRTGSSVRKSHARLEEHKILSWSDHRLSPIRLMYRSSINNPHKAPSTPLRILKQLTRDITSP
jgi:hypothetical protein